MEEAIRFMEADPWFFRSGFIKEEIVRRLKQAPLTDKQRRRLSGIVTRSLLSGTRRSARHVARLAPLADNESLRSHLESLARSSGEAARRATGVARAAIRGLKQSEQTISVVALAGFLNELHLALIVLVDLIEQ